MKKIIFLFVLFMFVLSPAHCEDDYYKLYSEVQPPDFALVNNIDPFQAEDYYNYTWAPCPLFRSSATLFFKGTTIPPGYYLLAPRTMKGKDYIFFKEAGLVKYIIPVVKKELVPEFFYENNIPRVKKTKWQEFCGSTSKKFYTFFTSSKKTPPPESFIKTHRVDNNLTLIILYYGQFKYSIVFEALK